MRLGALILAGALALGGLAAAAPPAGDPEATVVDELVVQARVVGPAWWKVSRGASAIWVMGVPSGLPRGMRWDEGGLYRRLAGARQVILPSTARLGLGDVFGAFALRGRLRAPTPIDAGLPPPLRARFVADSAALGQKPAHYAAWKPAMAGLFMVADFRKRAGLDDDEPLRDIRGAAARKGVRAQPAATYRALPIARDLAADLTPAANLACLEDGMQEVEAGPNRIVVAAQAWTRGDVRAALTAERGYERCIASFPASAALVRQGMTDEVNAIAEAGQTPGVSIAVVPLRALVADGGVLQQLQAREFAVETPGRE